MTFRELPERLQRYILIQTVALLPALLIVAWAPGKHDALLLGVLLAAAAAAGACRIELTVLRGKQSLVFAVVCLALLLQGLLAAVLCSALGALVTHLVKPDGSPRRLRYLPQPLYRRIFNVCHCAAVCAVAGLFWQLSQRWPAASPFDLLPGLLLFSLVYFFLNSFGIAAAIALEKGASPTRLWREHFFWMLPAHLACALAAGALAAACRAAGLSALVLLPGLYLVYRACRAYVDLLRKQQQLVKRLNQMVRREEESNRRKDEFLAMLGHELRNPLFAISNACYLLAEPEDREEQARDLQIIQDQTRHLERLVDDLVDVSRISRGKVELRRSLIDLREPVRRAVEAMEPQARLHGQALVLQAPEEPVNALADRDRIVQVVSNLVGNAVKHTPSGGRIEVTLHTEAEAAILQVRDNGAGMTLELLPHIFEPFVQGDRSLAHSAGGLGIGLTLVKQLVEMHGGAVEARSPGVNRGSEFYVRLPLTAEARKVTEGRDPASAPSIPGQDPGGCRVRVLVAEDQPDGAVTFAAVLRRWGYEVRLAMDGEEALRLALRDRPDLCILDVGLPGLDGHELARRLRAEVPNAILIAATGYGRNEERDAALAAGFHYHLAKPVDLEKLHTLLEEAVAQAFARAGRGQRS